MASGLGLVIATAGFGPDALESLSSIKLSYRRSLSRCILTFQQYNDELLVLHQYQYQYQKTWKKDSLFLSSQTRAFIITGESLTFSI